MLRDKRLEALISKKERQYYFLTLFFNIVAAFSFLIFAWQLTGILQKILFNQIGLEDIIPEIISPIIFVLIRFVSTVIAEYFASKVASNIQISLSGKILAHLQKMNIPALSARDPVILPGILVDGIERLYPFFADYIPRLLSAAALPVLYLIFAFPADWVSALVLLFTAPLIPVFIILINSHVRQKTQKQWEILQRLTSYFSDTMKAMLLIKLFNIREQKRQNISEMNYELGSRTLDILKIAFLSAFVLEFMATMGTAVIAVEVGLRLLHGALEFKTALFLLILAPEFYIPLRQSGGKFHAAKEASAAADDILEFLDHPLGETIPSGDQLPSAQPQTLSAENLMLSVDNKLLFEDVNFELKKGEILLVHGPVGCGKSSLAMAIMKYLPVESGKLKLDSIDLNDLNSKEYYKFIEFIPQFPYIFHNTIRYNINLNDNNRNDNDIWDVLQELDLYERFKSSLQGLDTIIGEKGMGLSGGERQRICLARAMLNPRPLLILDEISSHIDKRNETFILEKLKELKKERMIILISHREVYKDYADKTLFLS